MPHYKDGREAQVGDLVVGQPYNTGRTVVGEVLAVTPGQESCNLVVAFLERVEPATLYGSAALTMVKTGDGVGGLIYYRVLTDYGETGGFQKVG